MKRVVCMTALCVILFSASCKNTPDNTAPASSIDEANAYCNAAIPLAAPETETMFGGAFTRVEAWGCCLLSDGDACYVLSGYPDVLDAFHVTQIELLSSTYSIYGSTLHSDFQDCIEYLTSMDFQKDERLSRAYQSTVMVKNDIAIQIDGDNGRISGLKLRVAVTNTENVDF